MTDNQQKKKFSFKRIVSYFLISLLFLIILFLVASPHIAKKYINKHGKELAGRTINIDKLKINYFTFTLKALGAKMYEQNNSDVFVGFDSLLINMKPLRLLKKEINIQQFKIVNLHSSVIQNDTTFNFSDFIEFYASEEDDIPEDTTASPYTLNLNCLELKESSVSYTDQQLDNTIALHNINFILPHLLWGGKDDCTADVSFDLGDGGNFSSSLNYNTTTGDYSGEINLKRLNLKSGLPYVKEFINFSSISGTTSANIQFEGNQSDNSKLVVKGTSVTDSISATDPQGKKVLGTNKAFVEVKELKPLLSELKLGKLEIEQPYIYFALMDSLSNFERMLISDSTETNEDVDLENPDKKTEGEEEAINITIDSFIIKNGQIDFCDQTLYQPFDYEVSDIHVSTSDLSLNSDFVKILASMNLNKRGKFNSTIGINPLDPMQHIELESVLSEFQLPDVSTYSKHYTGLPILFGDMYYKCKTSIKNKQLNSKNKLVIRNVELGNKIGGLYDIPIKLALYILKDKNGDIELDIPVTGDLSNPKTAIGPIIWKTVKNLITQIATSPFKALGNLLGADSKELEEITFTYNDTTLTKKQKHSLDLLLKLEKMKPELQINIQYFNDRKLEKFDAASQIMQESFAQKTNDKATSNPKAYLEFLQTESGNDSLKMQDYERMLAPSIQTDSIVNFRETERIKLVKDYLKQQNDSTAISILEYKEEETQNIGSRPRFAISYGLSEETVSE